MQEMIELSKQQSNLPATEAKAVRYKIAEGSDESKTIFAGPAQFGRELGKGFSVNGPLVLSVPVEACRIPDNAKDFWGAIVIVRRGDCMFVGMSVHFVFASGCRHVCVHVAVCGVCGFVEDMI